MKHSAVFHSLFLLGIMTLCGLLSVYFGKEVSWDVANYHFYNPFALLHDRYAADIWPSSFIHQFINPAIDLPAYFLITHFTSSAAIFLLGALHGVSFWLLFLIAKKCVNREKFGLRLAAGITFLGMCGAIVFPEIGSLQNDNLICIFILGFIFFQLRFIENFQKRGVISSISLIFSGLLLGIGFGLKLTAGFYAAAALLAGVIFPVPFKLRLKILLIWGLTIAAGLLLSDGFWLYKMWTEHHNPLFPFFNSLFQSPDFALDNWRDKRFLPKTWMQTLFYPFYFSWDGRTSDTSFRDLRFPVVYILFLMSLAKYGWEKWKRKPISPLSLTERWLFTFFIFSYFIWQYYFSISRYLAALEMLCPLMIYLLLRQIFSDYFVRNAVLTVLFYSLLYFLSPLSVIRMTCNQPSFFNVKLPAHIEQIPKAAVFISYPVLVKNPDPRPLSYLIPFFPKDWRFIGIPFLGNQYLEKEKDKKIILQTLKNYRQPIYLITQEDYVAVFYSALKQFNLKPDGSCEKITSDRQKVTGHHTLLCPLSKL